MSKSEHTLQVLPSAWHTGAAGKGQLPQPLSIELSGGPGCTRRLPQGLRAQTRRAREGRRRAGGIQTNRPPLCRPQSPFTEDKPGLHFRVSISAARGWAGRSLSGDEAQELSANRRPRVWPRRNGGRCQIGQWKAHAPGRRARGRHQESGTGDPAATHTRGLWLEGGTLARPLWAAGQSPAFRSRPATPNDSGGSSG